MRPCRPPLDWAPAGDRGLGTSDRTIVRAQSPRCDTSDPGGNLTLRVPRSAFLSSALRPSLRRRVLRSPETRPVRYANLRSARLAPPTALETARRGPVTRSRTPRQAQGSVPHAEVSAAERLFAASDGDAAGMSRGAWRTEARRDDFEPRHADERGTHQSARASMRRDAPRPATRTRGDLGAQARRTYSKVRGLPSIPLVGAAIQLAIVPGAYAGCIRLCTYEPSESEGSHSPRRLSNSSFPIGFPSGVNHRPV